MIRSSARRTRRYRYSPVLRWVGLAASLPAMWACVSRTLDAPNITPTATETSTVTQKINNNIDILFMIDNSSSMQSMQQKLYAQLPTFMQILQNLPNGLPNVHIAVVSSDMGGPGDETSSIGCTPQGDNGTFQAQARGACTGTTLAQGATFISDVNNMPNFTDPIEKVFQCISLLGAAGCGFEQQLASIDRALGGDGSSPPQANANFLRNDAYLGIVILTNEDDNSAPPNTTIWSLNGNPQSIRNPDGPLGDYREFGGPRASHLCQDLKGTNTGFATPPITPPADAMGNPPQIQLSNCKDNDSGTSAFIPISKFVSDIKGLKPDPDNQILVGGIFAPPTPVGVQWTPPASPPPGASGELWPEVQQSCGAVGNPNLNPNATQFTTDGSFGTPGIRINQFIDSFKNSVVASICDPSYASSMAEIAMKLGALIKPSCITGKIQNNSAGQPDCSVINHLTDGKGNTMDVAVPSCNQNGGSAPCWTLTTDMTACPGGGLALKLTQDAASMNAASLNSTVSCSLCLPGSTAPGC